MNSLTGDNNDTGIPRLIKTGPLAGGLFIVVVLLFGYLQNEYNPVAQTVSELGSPEAPYSTFYNAGIVLVGVLLLLFSRGAYLVLKGQRGAVSGSVGLGLIGLMNVTGGIFPLHTGQMDDVSTMVHTISGLVMLAAYLYAVPRLNATARALLGRRATYRTLMGCWLVGAAGLLFMMFSQPYGMQGLGQRVFYLGFILWIGYFSYSLWKLQKQSS